MSTEVLDETCDRERARLAGKRLSLQQATIEANLAEFATKLTTSATVLFNNCSALYSIKLALENLELIAKLRRDDLGPLEHAIVSRLLQEAQEIRPSEERHEEGQPEEEPISE